MKGWNDVIQLILQILTNQILSGVGSICTIIVTLIAICRFFLPRNAGQTEIEVVVREVIRQLKAEHLEQINVAFLQDKQDKAKPSMGTSLKKMAVSEGKNVVTVNWLKRPIDWNTLQPYQSPFTQRGRQTPLIISTMDLEYSYLNYEPACKELTKLASFMRYVVTLLSLCFLYAGLIRPLVVASPLQNIIPKEHAVNIVYQSTLSNSKIETVPHIVFLRNSLSTLPDAD